MVAVVVRDYDEAIAWYRDALGFTLLEDSDRGQRPVRVTAEQVEPWLRTLTALRLVIAERLGISDEHPQGDPETALPKAHDFMLEVYDWLAYVQETLLGAL